MTGCCQTQNYRQTLPAFEPMLKGTCLHILGPHEHIQNSTYVQINPQIVSAEGRKEMGFCWFYSRSLHPTHGEKLHREQKQAWANESVGLIVSDANVHHSCTAEQVHSNIPPASSPLCLSLSPLSPFCLTPRVSLMFQTVRQGSRPFVVLEGNSEEVRGWL